MIKSQESTRQLFEFQRKCKFETESNLAYFPQIYSQDLCKLDCRMRKLRKICNCLPFFYKRQGESFNDAVSCSHFLFYGSSQTPTKSVTSKDSSASSRTKVRAIVIQFNGFGVKSTLTATVEAMRGDDCSCLKDCNDIKYSVQASNIMFWFHDSRISWTMMQTKVIYKRELIHGFIEVLVSTGANLSLFVGISCLTLVETLFFIYLIIKNRLQILLGILSQPSRYHKPR